MSVESRELKAEQRDKFLSEIDDLARWAGASDFEEAAQLFKRLCVAFLTKLEPMQTREDFKNLLDGLPDLTFKDELMMKGLFRTFPQVLRYGLKQLANKAEKELPAPPTGRPPINYDTRAEIVTFIGQLNMRGTALEVCKKRAAQRFCCGVATVERIWIERGQIEEVDFRSALKWWSESFR